MIATIIANVTKWPWPMVAAAVSMATLLLVAWVNIGRPIKRKRKLRKPVIAEFVIPSRKHHPCAFAEQDDQEHLLKTIILPPNSKVTIDFRFTPRLNFHSSEIQIGCIGAVDKIPYAFEYLNRFIKDGDGQSIKPGPDNRHYLDKHNYYHMRDSNLRSWSVGGCLAVAFTIKTREPGRYPVELYFPGDEIEGKADDLVIVVEEKPHTVMQCIDKKHRRASCAQGIKPKRKAKKLR